MTEKSLLKPFEPMLASPRGKLKFPCMLQPKYDGIRCVVRNGVAMSRNLEPIANDLIRMTLSHPDFNGFDGELILGDPTAKDVYNATQDVVMDASADPTGITYFVFDDFTDPRVPYQLRYAKAQARIAKLCDDPEGGIIQAVPANLIDDEVELMALAEPLFEMGYEGGVVRDFHAIYKHGRATESEGSLWKIKRMQDDEILIIAVEEGETNTNEKTVDKRGKAKRSKAKEGMIPNGKLGCLVGINESLWPGVEVRVGSSNLPDMPMAEAIEYFVGKTVVFKHQPAGAKDAPRFPIYKAIRDPRDMSRSRVLTPEPKQIGGVVGGIIHMGDA
jgi:DNA ligase-1